jgi:hypothetical protein
MSSNESARSCWAWKRRIRVKCKRVLDADGLFADGFPPGPAPKVDRLALKKARKHP